MRRAILAATLFLLSFAGSAFAAEPEMVGRHGLGTEWWNPPTLSRHVAKQTRSKHVHKAIPQTHERVIGYAGDLAHRARSYLGTNPTGKSSLWCGRFMAMIAPQAAARVKNPDMARDWAALPHVSAQVGAIAVLSRGKHGGHIGVVTGFDGDGNPTIVSGNHGHRVGEGTYSKSRVIAYVSAT